MVINKIKLCIKLQFADVGGSGSRMTINLLRNFHYNTRLHIRIAQPAM